MSNWPRYVTTDQIYWMAHSSALCFLLAIRTFFGWILHLIFSTMDIFSMDLTFNRFINNLILENKATKKCPLKRPYSSNIMGDSQVLCITCNYYLFKSKQLGKHWYYSELITSISIYIYILIPCVVPIFFFNLPGRLWKRMISHLRLMFGTSLSNIYLFI